MIIVILKGWTQLAMGFSSNMFIIVYIWVFKWFSLSRVKRARLPISRARPRLLRTLGCHTWRQPGCHCTIQPTWQRKCKLGWMGLANVAWISDGPWPRPYSYHYHQVMDHGHGQGHINLSPFPLNSYQIVSTLKGNGDKLTIQVDINVLKYLDMMGFMVVAPNTTLKPPKNHHKTHLKPP